MNQSRKITEGAIYVAIFVILMLATFLPILSFFAIIMLPVPFVIYTSRHGAKSGLVMLAAATLITILFFTIFSLPLTLMMAVGGLCIGHAIYKKRTAYETWGYGILGFIFGLLFTIAFTQVIFNVNFFSEFETMATEQMETYITIIESIGISGDPDIDLETIFQEQIRIMMNLVPAILIFIAVFLAFIVQWVSYKVLNRVEKKTYRFPPIRTMRLPASILWLYLIVIFISFFDLNPANYLYTGIHNALIILEMLLALQGISFIFFFAHYKNWSKAIPILSIVLTVLFPIILLSFVRILGIIDMGLSLRERLTNNNQSGK